MTARLTDPPKAMHTAIREAVFEPGQEITLEMNHHPIAVERKPDGIHVWFAVRVKALTEEE